MSEVNLRVYEIIWDGELVDMVAKTDFDAQRLRADTAEAESTQKDGVIEDLVQSNSDMTTCLAAAEQRIALMSKLLSRCIPVCRFKNSHTERDLIAEINAALNPKPEAGSHE